MKNPWIKSVEYLETDLRVTVTRGTVIEPTSLILRLSPVPHRCMMLAHWGLSWSYPRDDRNVSFVITELWNLSLSILLGNSRDPLACLPQVAELLKVGDENGVEAGRHFQYLHRAPEAQALRMSDRQCVRSGKCMMEEGSSRTFTLFYVCVCGTCRYTHPCMYMWRTETHVQSLYLTFSDRVSH